jgi:glucokinase
MTKYAIVDVRGNILGCAEMETTQYSNINDFATTLSEGIVMLAEQTCGYEKVRSVGISVSSGNFLTNSIENSKSLAWSGQVPLAAMMRDRLGLAVALANNAHVRALGEFTYGNAHGMREFIVVTLGYGFGSCLFSHGRPHLGAEGFAGEIGHTCIDANGRMCGCGKRGCLEAYCATKGVLQTAREVMEERDVPSLMRGCENLTPKMITEFCDQGDELAIETYRRTGHILGIGLANYASVIDPEAIIFTGGISKAGKWLLEPTNEAFEAHVFHNVQNKIKLLNSELSSTDCDLLGAGALAWKVEEYSLFK